MSKQEVKKARPEETNRKYRDRLNATAKTVQEAPELSEKVLLKKIANTLEGELKKKKAKEAQEAVATLIALVIVGLLVIWGYRSCSKVQETGDESQRRTRESYRVEDVRSRPKRTPEHNLAIIHEGWKVPRDHTTVFRFRYLLQQLDAQCIQSKQEIADMTVKAQQVIREERGIKMNLLSMMEEMNRFVKIVQTKRFYVSFLKFCKPETAMSPDVAVTL